MYSVSIVRVPLGYTVDSTINIAPFLIYLEISINAVLRALRSGRVFLIKGVGTVIIKKFESFNMKLTIRSRFLTKNRAFCCHKNTEKFVDLQL